MAVMGRPKAALVLTDEERASLRRLSRRRSTSQALALRARIVLRCERLGNSCDVAEELGVTDHTVGKWRLRFIERRLDGLYDEPRVGGPRTIGDELVERVIQTTLTRKPRGATHWSTRLLACELGISSASVSRIWRSFGLQPHRTESFSLSKDPQFVQKVRDIVGLYMRPPESALVLCVDAWTRSRRSRRSIEASRSCRCSSLIPNGGRTTTLVTARRLSSPRWISQRATSSESASADIERRSSSRS